MAVLVVNVAAVARELSVAATCVSSIPPSSLSGRVVVCVTTPAVMLASTVLVVWRATSVSSNCPAVLVSSVGEGSGEDCWEGVDVGMGGSVGEAGASATVGAGVSVGSLVLMGGEVGTGVLVSAGDRVGSLDGVRTGVAVRLARARVGLGVREGTREGLAVRTAAVASRSRTGGGASCSRSMVGRVSVGVPGVTVTDGVNVAVGLRVRVAVGEAVAVGEEVDTLICSKALAMRTSPDGATLRTSTVRACTDGVAKSTTVGNKKNSSSVKVYREHKLPGLCSCACHSAFILNTSRFRYLFMML
jgi:hypothetical protein